MRLPHLIRLWSIGVATVLAAVVTGGKDGAHAAQWAGTATVRPAADTMVLALGSGSQPLDILIQDALTPAIPLLGDGYDDDGDGAVDEDLVIGVDEDGDCPGDTNNDGNRCRVGDQGVDEDPVNLIDDDYKIGGGEGGGDPANCRNGVDDDEDGLVDSEDPECADGDGQADEDPPPGQRRSDDDRDGREGSSSPLGTCDDQLDNDGDGLRDLQDPDCAGKIDEDPTERFVDNDGDGRMDEDPVDSQDNDGDGLTDEDPSEQIDNDGDGRTNEDGRNEDGDGSEFGGRYPTNCADGLDNDSDGLMDDADPQCAPYIDEDGGQDDDGDGWVDEDGSDDDRDGRSNEDGPFPCLVDTVNPFAGTLPCGVGGYTLKITYDPAIVQFSNVTNGPFLTSNGRIVVFCGTATGSNYVQFTCFTRANPANPATNGGPEGSGTLATVRFSSLQLGLSPVTLTGTAVVDAGGRSLQLTLMNRTIQVARCADVSGNGFVNSTDVLQVRNRTGTIAGQPGWDSRYDINQNGAVNSQDVVITLQESGQSCTFVP